MLVTIRQLLTQNRKAAGFLSLAVLAGSAAALTVILLAIILSLIVSRVFLDGGSLGDVTNLLFAALAVLAVRGCAVWAKEILGQRSASKLKRTLRQRLSSHLFRLGPIFTRGERSGELVSTIVEGAEELDVYISQYLPTMALAVIAPLMVFFAVLILDPWSTLVLLVAAPMMLLILALIGGRAKEITERRFLELSWMSAFFLDILQGLPTLKMFGRDGDQAENIREISSQYGRTTMEILHTAFQSSLVMEWAATAATAMVALEVSLRLMNGNLPFPVALTVLLLTPEFFLPIRQYALRFHAGTAGKAAAVRIFEILDTNPSETRQKWTTGNRLIPDRLDIRFEQVCFAYEGGERRALQDFSMEMQEGRTTVLVGPTGAGKSTVSQLLLRFAAPDSGVIKAGGGPINSFALDLWRDIVAWVPQNPYLFHGTIAENIRLAKPGAAFEDVVRASRCANAHEFIEELPGGYGAQVGERGARLSGGQRQRIAIARAFLKDAPILILDEPMAHLDKRSSELVQSSISRLISRRTVLVIAHHLEFADDADHIVVLEEGRAVEMGSHKELLSAQGAYSRLYSAFRGLEAAS